MTNAGAAYLCLSLLLALPFPGTGQPSGKPRWVTLATGEGVPDRVEIRPELNQMVFEAEVGAVELVHTGRTPETYRIRIAGFYDHGKEGGVFLPRTTRMIESGSNPGPRLVVERLDSVVFDLNDRGIRGEPEPFRPSGRKVPSGKHARAGPGPVSPVTNDPPGSDTGLPVLALSPQGTLRGVEIHALHFSPVRYDSVARRLTVYHRVRARIHHRSHTEGLRPGSRPFENLLDRVTRQPVPAEKALRSEGPMTLVILSDTLFREALQPLVEWKTRKGFRVVEAYRQESSVGGTRESMKAYLKDLYTSPPPGILPPSYLLIVGDVQHIPVSQPSGQITDLYYAEYDGGGDYIPDLFYGRISVAGADQLEAVVEKILEYEQYHFPDDRFLDRSVLIAGVDGTYASTHGNGQIRYAATNYLRSEGGYQARLFPYPESDTARGSILGLISEGAGFVNYTGHGETDRWRDPRFTISDIDSLDNAGMYPLMIGNGCETNVFTLEESFAEALIRAPAKGALAYIGCTNDSYWDEDYFWAVGVGPIRAEPLYEETTLGYFDRVFHTRGEAFSDWTPSAGEMVFGGNLAVQQSSSGRKKFYWEIYQLAGDPTLVPWFRVPAVQELTLPSLIPQGTRRLDLQCAPNSYLALSREGRLIDARHASEAGQVSLRIPDTLSPGILTLVVTGDRFRPFTDTIRVGNPSGPYLDLLGSYPVAESVEPDGSINPGEEFILDLHLVNRGGEGLPEDTLVLSAAPPVRMLDSLWILPGLAPGDSVVARSVFRARADTLLGNGTELVLTLSSGDQDREFYIRRQVRAPELHPAGLMWDDRPLGNGNGIAEPGETLNCIWSLTNAGDFRTFPLQALLVNSSPGFEGQAEFPEIQVIGPGDTVQIPFLLTLGSSVNGLQGTGMRVRSGSVPMSGDSLILAVGQHYEGFDTGNPRYPFYSSGNGEWAPDNRTFRTPGYSMRSGAIGHNRESNLEIELEVLSADSIAFSYRVSSESRYDYLRFFVDSVRVGRWSGETGWNRVAFPLTAGTHTIRWSYSKDQNTDRGEDAAWIDDVLFPEAAVWKRDASLLEILLRESAPWSPGGEEVGFRLGNPSPDTLSGMGLAVTLPSGAVEHACFADTLLPGAEAVFRPGLPLVLPDTGVYLLEAEIITDTAGFLGNNRLTRRFRRYAFPDMGLALVGTGGTQGLFAEVTTRFENLGNRVMDSVAYRYRVDGKVKGGGSLTPALQPGQTRDVTFRMLDSTGRPASALYDYEVELLEPDSVRENDRIRGTLEWIALNSGSPGNQNHWTLYPVPASGSVILTRSGDSAEESFSVVTLAGQPVRRILVPDGLRKIRVPLDGVPPGMYLITRNRTGESLPLLIR